MRRDWVTHALLRALLQVRGCLCCFQSRQCCERTAARSHSSGHAYIICVTFGLLVDQYALGVVPISGSAHGDACVHDISAAAPRDPPALSSQARYTTGFDVYDGRVLSCERPARTWSHLGASSQRFQASAVGCAAAAYAPTRAQLRTYQRAARSQQLA